MKRLSRMLPLLFLLSLLPLCAQESNNRLVSGTITSLTMDDPGVQRDSTSAERNFAVRLTLDSVEGTVLGFARLRRGGSPEIQRALLDMAMLAFEKDLPVTLYLEHPINASVNPRAQSAPRSHVRIVGIRVYKSPAPTTESSGM